MKAFMCALMHDQSCNFVNYLEKYIDPTAPYIIGLETAKDTHQDTSGQHFHVCVNMTDKQYDSFRNTILVKHYGLRGQARGGRPRQYGSVRNVRDHTKMLQYTVKDQNIIYKNYSLDTIQDLIQSSYHRPDKRDLHSDVIKYLMLYEGEVYPPIYDLDHANIQYDSVEKLTITYLIKKTDKIPTKSLVQTLVRSFLTHRARLYNHTHYIEELINYLTLK